MNWVVFAIVAILALVADISFLDGVALDRGVEGARLIRPSLCAAVAAFVALSATRNSALWACFVLGLLLDLSTPLSAVDPESEGVGIVHLVGPYTLGYVLGGWVVLRLRTMVFRQRPLTIAVMTCGMVMMVSVVVVSLYGVRSLYPGVEIGFSETSLTRSLLQRFAASVYAGLLALPVGWALARTIPLWGFDVAGGRAIRRSAI